MDPSVMGVKTPNAVSPEEEEEGREEEEAEDKEDE